MADTNQRRKRGERNGGRKDAATVKHVVKRYRSSLPEVYLLVVLVMFGGNLAAVVWSYSWLPEPRVVSTVDSDSIRSPDAVGEFYEHRARKHLDILTSFGPRTTGSVENEEMAFRYILKELNKIKPHPQKKYEKDVQRPEGSFSLHLIKDFSNYYRNVTNIIARVGPGETAMSPGKKNKKTRPSLLVNCHFDSVPDSPGASDDAGSCAVLLEILRILVESDEPLKHSVIFLFNGAEENILHASHGFITNHQWRKDIKAFLNFESAGSGGREVVFQTGPHHPWLVHAYAATAKYPLANSFAQDLFQSGVIPADTDFRIFRDYGDVPGIDMAYVTNGYVYHTEYDEPQRIYPGSLQAAGDNILALIKHIANSPYLEDPEEYRHGDMIYFDVLGFFLVAYPVRIATLLNGCILLYVLTSIWQRVLANEDEYEGPVGLSYLFHLLLAVGIISFSWCLSFLVTITIGYLLSMAGYGMFWFTSNSLIFGVYGCPALLTLISVHIIAKHYFYKKRFTNLWEVESIYFDATLLLWMSFLAVATAKHSMSSYILLMWVAFPVVFRRLTSLFFSDHLNAMPPRLFFGSHTVSLVIPTLMSMYIIWMLFLLVLPITGRIGSVVKPDLLIAALLTFAVVSCTSYLMSLVYVLRRLEGTYLVLSIMFLTMLGITVATPYGFPYGGNPLYPTPKRMFTQHSIRKFHDISGSVWKEDSHLYIVPLDDNGLQHLLAAHPELKDAKAEHCVENAPYCGIAHYLPIGHMMRKSVWLPASPVNTIDPVQFKLVQNVKRTKSVRHLKFSLLGSERMTVYIQPKKGVLLTKWSLRGKIGKSADVSNDGVYFINYGHGYATSPWVFWIELDTTNAEDDGTDAILNIAVAAHHFHKDDVNKSKDLLKYLKKDPVWVTATKAISTYESWVF